MSRARIQGRGQTLVLFALTLLLLTVLVLMSLGLGMRMHERQELQTVADAAAYSEAVSEARAFNELAVQNRVLIAQLASIAAAQSMLSWLGFYHGTLNQARDVLEDMQGLVPCRSAALTNARAKIMAEDLRLIQIWEPLNGGYVGIDGHDVIAGNYIRKDLYATAIEIAEDQKKLYRQVHATVGDATDEIARVARQGSPWGTNPAEMAVGVQRVTREELETGTVQLQRKPIDMVRATMAARGVDPFVSSREGNPHTQDMSAATYVKTRIGALVAPLQIDLTDYGTSYFGDDGPQLASGPALGESVGYDGQALNRPDWKKWANLQSDEDPLIWGAWAQDYGTFHFVMPAGCNASDPTEDSFGYILTTGPTDDRDNHMWRRGNQGFGDYRERNDELNHVKRMFWPDKRHSFLVTPPDANAPSIWPVYTDYNAELIDDGRASRINTFGQPKTLANVTRKYESRGSADPWDLRFRFGFTAGGGTTLDLRETRAGLKHAVALAAGLVYYHRGRPAVAGPAGKANRDHSREPPNFLNPFWRATLAASDVDESYPARGKDAEDTLRRDLGETAAADALSQLRGKGFEAMP